MNTQIEHEDRVQDRDKFLEFIKSNLTDNPICVEIGVYQGEFAKNILDTLQPSILHLIDPWEIGSDKNSKETHYSGEISDLSTAYSTDEDFKQVNDIFSEEIKEGKVVLNKHYSYDAVDMFEDNYFDFIYIDACHLYDSVKADLEMFLPKLKTNGILCGHDYMDDPRGSNFNVVQAVDEFCENFNFEMIVLGKVPHCDWGLKNMEIEK